MRRTILLTLATLALGACSQDRTDPAGLAEIDAFTVDFTAVAYGITGVQPGAGLPELGRLKRLPPAIALTPEQEATITHLLEDFQAANQHDIDALTTLLSQAREARQAGEPRAEVAALLQQARIIHLRLAEATAALKVDIDNVLTEEQRTWLVSRSPAHCYPTVVAPLSSAQKAEIQALHRAFREATAEDRAAVRAAFEDAREARKAGKSRDEIRAILDSVKEELARLQAAGTELRADIDAVLTARQRASGCFGPGRP